MNYELIIQDSEPMDDEDIGAGPSKKTKKKDIENENENVENQNVEDQNVENEDIDNQNVENQIFETQNVENENVEIDATTNDPPNEFGDNPNHGINIGQIENIIKEQLGKLTSKEYKKEISIQIAAQVVQLLNKKQQEPSSAFNKDEYWQKYDDYYICNPCALHHKRRDFPAEHKKSIKCNYGMIKNSSKLTKGHLKRSKNDHCVLESHKWCVKEYEKKKETKLTYEEANAAAGKIVISNALFCFKRSLSSKDFVAMNAKEQICHPETAATKNDSAAEFFKLRNVVFDVLSEKTVNFFQKIKSIAVTLDKVTTNRTRYHSNIT